MPFDEERLYSELADDICARDCPKYDNLVLFVHNLLSKKVRRWCYNDSALRGGLHDEDVMQEIQIRIIKKCETYFFKPVHGVTDKTCSEFKAWCNRVAKNYFLTYCVKQKNRKEVALNLSITEDNQSSMQVEDDYCSDETENLETHRSDLKRCFEIVFDLKSSPHIILTWLSVSLFMLLKEDTSKIDSTHMVVQKFSSTTLFEMFDIIISAINKVGWVVFTDEQINRQKRKLESINKDTGKMIGNMKYEEFYMNKGPEMSISDWVNRINMQIKKQLNGN